jgi:hypothetical protein
LYSSHGVAAFDVGVISIASVRRLGRSGWVYSSFLRDLLKAMGYTTIESRIAPVWLIQRIAMLVTKESLRIMKDNMWGIREISSWCLIKAALTAGRGRV